MTTFRRLDLDRAESVEVLGGSMRWIPVRRPLGIRAFGMNAYSADAGQDVVEPHDESEGQEEVYVVLRGRATFEVGDERIDVPAGSMVFLPEGDVRRYARAEEDGTLVLAVGGYPGRPFTPSAWEPIFLAHSEAEAGDFAGAAQRVRDAASPEQLDTAAVQYTLARHLGRAGDVDGGLAALRRALELDGAQVREWAAGDADIDPLRSAPGFPL